MSHTLIHWPTQHNTIRAVFMRGNCILSVAEGSTLAVAAELSVGRAIDRGDYDDASPIRIRRATHRDIRQWYLFQSDAGEWRGRVGYQPNVRHAAYRASMPRPETRNEIEAHHIATCKTADAAAHKLRILRRVVELLEDGTHAVQRYYGSTTALSTRRGIRSALRAIGRSDLADLLPVR